ncbi:sporulation protein [Aurantiacibacter aquimixticola]|uniref:Sporulation protein n=2 Tax=Aurantiacibacter aquimixticola TaxID=1958945 RepID=A0A419RTP0_9SPHN|nr:sporulation protein [Aurantiacibacter aquimixticola]
MGIGAMSLWNSTWLGGALLSIAVSIAMPAAAQSVRDGVDAWSRGDYPAAIAQWEGPASEGDADALFNLAQAYRLGRGVPMDLARAEDLYARAAAAGHLRAADTYGLILFQDGRREEALPYVVAAARRGDPRAQYLLGIAHFNGDLVERDWERAYALLTLANADGLPQAGPAIAQMDGFIPLEQRQAAAGLARQLQAEAEAARSVELAAADLSVSEDDRARSPEVVAARDAVQQARVATGTASPADAGASFAQAERPASVTTPAPEPTRTVAAAPARPSARASGPWRVQLGAFGVPGNAERLWTRLSSRPEIAGRERLLIPTGRVTRLQAGGYASRAEAQSACNSLRRVGQDCLVTRN